jgi:hypothetical protein
MPIKSPLYLVWMDTYFYVWAAVFIAALFAMIYAIRRYLELKNAASFEEAGQEGTENLFVEDEQDATLVLPPAEQPELPVGQPETGTMPEAEATLRIEPEPAASPEPAPSQEAPPQEPNRAENFVRGIYAGISDLDERMKGIEAALSKSHVNSDFTVKFLEDILQDIDSLDKTKIKNRIEYLLSDLKK